MASLTVTSQLVLIEGKRTYIFDEWLYNTESTEDERKSISSIIPRNVVSITTGTSGQTNVFEEDEQEFYNLVMSDFKGNTFGKYAESRDVIVLHVKEDGSIIKSEIFPSVIFKIDSLKRNGDSKAHRFMNEIGWKGYGFARVYGKYVHVDKIKPTTASGKITVQLSKNIDTDGVLMVRLNDTYIDKGVYTVDKTAKTVTIDLSKFNFTQVVESATVVYVTPETTI